eukprot:gene2267-2790_t
MNTNNLRGFLKLITFEFNNPTQHNYKRIGVLFDQYIVDVCSANSSIPTSMKTFIEGGKDNLIKILKILESGGNRIPIEKIKICPPIDNPDKVICVGLNYMEHAKESGAPIPKEPVLFSKFSSSIIGPNEPIIKPDLSDEVDYEVELVVVIGKEGKNIKREEALDYVIGYTVGNDISARDWQLRKSAGQWLLGKTFDTFAPIGPSIVVNPSWAALSNESTLDPNQLSLKCILNGDIMQNSNTSEFIFKVEDVISYISNIFTLKPGDIIFTGTPSGVGFTRKPPVFLKRGDTITCEIEILGSLTNLIK